MHLRTYIVNNENYLVLWLKVHYYEYDLGIGELGVSGPLKHFLSASNLQCMQMKTEMVPTDHPLNSLHTKHISFCSYQIK